MNTIQTWWTGSWSAFIFRCALLALLLTIFIVLVVWGFILIVLLSPFIILTGMAIGVWVISTFVLAVMFQY